MAVICDSVDSQVVRFSKQHFQSVGPFAYGSLRPHLIPIAFGDKIASLMISLECCVLADETGKEVIRKVKFVHPASWWQHFKQTWPGWLRLWFPPVMKTTTREIRWVVRGFYPYSNLAIPEEQLGTRIHKACEEPVDGQRD